jgi:hypothetical protein
MQQQTFGFQSIPAGTAALLLILFQRLGHPGMDHKTNIRLIDSHAKSDRGDYYIDFIACKFFLIPHAVSIFKTGMVGPYSIAGIRK